MRHKAWCVKRHEHGDERFYVLAATPGKAKSVVYRSEYRDCWDLFTKYTCCRVPQLDYDDEAGLGDPHEEPLTFFSVWRVGLMRMDCAVCGTRVEGSSMWSNPWTVFCRDHWQDEEPYIRRNQAWYQPVDPNNPMIWVGEHE